MTTSYYLVGIGTGHVLAKNTKEKSGRVVLENKGEQDDEQKWTVEFGDEPDLVALKCVADGKYMNSPETGVKHEGVTLGDRQWWKVSNDGLTPDVACRFSLTSSPDQFLYTDGRVLEKGQIHTAHMREWKQNWQKDFGFYFVDTSTGFESAAPMPATSATHKEKLVASNVESQSMDSPKTFYVTATTHGHVMAQLGSKDSSRVEFEYTRNRNDKHKWTIEGGDEPDIVALKNVANGKYLRCPKVEQYGHIVTGDKQWWRASKDTTPVGSFRLFLVDNPKLSLYYGVGNFPIGDTMLNKYEEGREFKYTLYFTDTSETPDLSVLGSSSGAASNKENSLASNTKPQSMDSTSTFYLGSTNRGYALSHQKSGNPSDLVLKYIGAHGDEQKWTVEFGDDPDTIALKNVANSKYLRCFDAASQGKVGTGEKQWWRVSRGRLTAPGHFRLSTINTPKTGYLYGLGRDMREGENTSTGIVELGGEVDYNITWFLAGTSTISHPISSSDVASQKQIQPPLATTDSPKPIYISFGRNGYVLTFQESGRPSGVVVEHKGDRGDEQKWTIEYGDQPNIIALQNVANGKYLRCHEAQNGGKVGTGEKQWWKITVRKYSPPGGCSLAPIDNPKQAFLTSLDRDVYQGSSPSTSNDVKMTTETGTERALAWYFNDVATISNPVAEASSVGAASKEESDAKQKALEEREAALSQKETDQSAELDKRAKELQERQDSLDKEEKKRAASKTDFDTKLKALEDREATLTQKDKDRSAELGKREKEIQDRQGSSEKEGKDREAASTKKDKDRSTDLDKKARELQEREDALARGEKDRQTASTKKDKDASAEWDKKMEEVQERQNTLAKEEKDRAASYEKKLKDLQFHEDAMAKKEKDQKKSPKDTPSSKSNKDASSTKSQADKNAAAETRRKLDDLRGTEQKVAADRASLEKSQAIFAVQQEQFRKRQKAFEDKKSASRDDASQARDENAALEKRMAELEDQLTQMDNARNDKSGKPQANDTDVSSVGCKFIGQKHYKPPRKLGRKVIGIVYE